MGCAGWTLGIAILAGSMTMTCVGRAQATHTELWGEPDVRVIQDAALGSSWILKRDPVHPNGPGRLVQVNSAVTGRIGEVRRTIEPVVIHVGDRVVMEKDTEVVQAELEAVALGNAAANHPLLVRVVIGGGIVHVIAIKPGNVRWTGDTQP